MKSQMLSLSFKAFVTWLQTACLPLLCPPPDPLFSPNVPCLLRALIHADPICWNACLLLLLLIL